MTVQCDQSQGEDKLARGVQAGSLHQPFREAAPRVQGSVRPFQVETAGAEAKRHGATWQTREAGMREELRLEDAGPCAGVLLQEVRTLTLSGICREPKVPIVRAMVFPVVMYGCEGFFIRKLSAEELMLLNCGAGEVLRVP